MLEQLLFLDTDIHVAPEVDTRYLVLPKYHIDQSSVSRSKLKVSFTVPDITCEIFVFYKLEGHKRVSFETISEHFVPNTSCNVIVKGVLGDQSESDYLGKIIIKPEAHQTSSFLTQNILVTGMTTKNISQPILEIEANDVKASHGSTTGQIDTMQMYYLKTRGFDDEQAKNMIINGFFDTILAKVTRAQILQILSQTLGGSINA